MFYDVKKAEEMGMFIGEVIWKPADWHNFLTVVAQGLPFSESDWNSPYSAPSLFDSDGHARAKPTDSQKASIRGLRALRDNPTQEVASYLNQPRFSSKDLGAILEVDSDESTADASSAGGAGDRKRMCDLIAPEELKEEARTKTQATKTRGGTAYWDTSFGKSAPLGSAEERAVTKAVKKAIQRGLKDAKKGTNLGPSFIPLCPAEAAKYASQVPPHGWGL